MAYGTSDVEGLVQELRNNFAELHKDAATRRDLANARHGPVMEKELEKLGYPRIRTIVSYEVEWATRKVVATLSAPEYAVHIDPDHDADKARADQHEMQDGNFLLRVDSSGILSRAIHRHQAQSAYAPVWVQQNAFTLPVREKNGDGKNVLTAAEYNRACDSYRRRYQPIRVEVSADITDTAFLDDGQLNVTAAVREYEIPVVDFVTNYGDYKKDDEVDQKTLLSIWDKDFATLRSGYGMGEAASSFAGSQKIKICLFDEGSKIRHYVVMPAAQSDGKGRKLAPMEDFNSEGEWANPFGIPSLVVACGYYNSGAYRPEDRYMSFLLAMMQSRRNLDFTQSEWASRSAERPRYAAPLPPDVQKELMTADGATREAFLKSLSNLVEGRVNPTFGTVTNVDAEANVYEEKLYEQQKLEHDQYVPRGAFAGGDSSAVTLRNAPVSSLLKVADLEDQDYVETFSLYHNVLLKLLQMKDHFWRYNAPKGEKSVTVTTGRERIYGKQTPRGKKIEWEGRRYDYEFERSILRVDRRASTILTNLQAAKERMTMPDGSVWITDEEMATILGKENSEEYITQIRAEGRYKRIRDAHDSLILAASIRQDALTLGVDATEYLMAQSAGAGVPPGAPQSTAGGVGGGGGGSTGGIVRMASPASDQGTLETSGMG